MPYWANVCANRFGQCYDASIVSAQFERVLHPFCLFVLSLRVLQSLEAYLLKRLGVWCYQVLYEMQNQCHALKLHVGERLNEVDA